MQFSKMDECDVPAFILAILGSILMVVSDYCQSVVWDIGMCSQMNNRLETNNG